MKKTTALFCVTMLLTGCKFSRSVEKDLVSGLTSAGRDLSCEDVFIMTGGERTSRNSFIYGETFTVTFYDMKGFTQENGALFPAMEIILTDNEGNIILMAEDIYERFTEGISYSPLTLSADLTMADPIVSGGKYDLTVNISDKKGSGTFRSGFHFSVKENEKLKVKVKDVVYDEVYLFSQGNNRTITNNEIGFNDIIYIIVEGLRGFTEENGIVYPGLKLKAKDSRNEVILDFEDLFLDYSTEGVDADEFISRVSAHFSLTGTTFNNPLNCEVKIWDKKSNASLTVTTEMIVK